MSEQKHTASPQSSPRNGPVAKPHSKTHRVFSSNSITKVVTEKLVSSPLKHEKAVKRPSAKKSKTVQQPLPSIIPATPLFDDSDKWTAHVMMTANTLASQKSIGTDGITFPVRIAKWKQNKTNGGDDTIGMNATGANRGAIIVNDKSDKNGKRDMKSYSVSVECAPLANVVLRDGTANKKPHIFIALDIKTSRNSGDVKIDAPISRITGELITHRAINVGQHLHFFTNNSNIKMFTSMDIAYAVKSIASLSTAPSNNPVIWEMVNTANKLGVPAAKPGECSMLNDYKPTRFCKLPQLPLEVLQSYYDRTNDKMNDTERANLELEFPEIAFQRQTLRNGQNIPVRMCSNLNCSMFMSAVKMDYIGQGVGDFLIGLDYPDRLAEIESAFEWMKAPLERNVYIVSRPSDLQSNISQNRGRKQLDIPNAPARNPDITTRWAVEVFNGESGLKCYSKIAKADVPCLRFGAIGETWQPGCYYKDPECVLSRILINAHCAAWDKQIRQAYGIAKIDAWIALAPQFLQFGTNVFSCRVNVIQTNRIPSVAQNGKNMMVGDQLTCALDVEEIFSDLPTLLTKIGIHITKEKALEIIKRTHPSEADICKCDTMFLQATTCLSEQPDQVAAAIAAKCTYYVTCNMSLEELVPMLNHDCDIGDAIFSPAWYGNDDITLQSGKVLKASDDLRKTTKYMKIHECPIRYVWAIRPDIKSSHDRFAMVMKILHDGGEYDDNGMPFVADPGAAGKRANTVEEPSLTDIDDDDGLDN